MIVARAVGRRAGDERGMVLLEAALAIPLLALVALSILGVGRLVVAELAVADAARDAALLASRGAPSGQVSQAVREQVPDAEVAVYRERATTVATVTAAAPVLPGIPRIRVTHQATAVAATEPGLP